MAPRQCTTGGVPSRSPHNAQHSTSGTECIPKKTRCRHALTSLYTVCTVDIYWSVEDCIPYNNIITHYIARGQCCYYPLDCVWAVLYYIYPLTFLYTPLIISYGFIDVMA